MLNKYTQNVQSNILKFRPKSKMKCKPAVVILLSSPESPFAPQTAPASINITEKPMKVCDNDSLMHAFRL